MTQITHWSDFQSLIQIAVTMNGAYFTVTQFLPPFVPTEKSILEALAHEAHQYQEQHRFPKDKEHDFQSRFLSIISDMNRLSKFDMKVMEKVRTIAIACFLLGLGLLTYSSFNAPREIPSTGQLVAVGFTLPVPVGILYMGIISIVRYSPARKQRKAIEAMMRAACLESRHRSV